jgi:putative thioredoxin
MVDFQKDVIDKSYQIPVVVDFWAPWCGPCRVLGPVMEEIAQEQKEKWVLVKINTEEQEDIASRYKIRSIPNVKLFYRGEVIHEFMGALAKGMILDWLTKALPSPGLIALDHILNRDEDPSVTLLDELLDKYPEVPEIRLVLSQMILWEQPEKATSILEPVKLGSPVFDKANDIRHISALLQLDTTDSRIKDIQELLSSSEVEEGIKKMIEVLGTDAKAADGILAKASIGVFNTLGVQHPLSKTYRKKLDMVLWA